MNSKIWYRVVQNIYEKSYTAIKTFKAWRRIYLITYVSPTLITAQSIHVLRCLKPFNEWAERACFKYRYHIVFVWIKDFCTLGRWIEKRAAKQGQSL